MHIINQYIFGPPIPTEGLVAYYPFNGNANDESGNGNNGIVNLATLATGRKGDANHAYQFTKGVDSKIDVSSIGHLPSLSISVWVKQISGDNMGIVWKGNPSTIGDYSIGQSAPNYRNHLNGVFQVQTPSITFTDWNHIVSIWDSVSGFCKIYANGVFSEQKVMTSIDNLYSTILIGQYYNSSFSFNGYIDDIRFYNRGLNQKEVNQLYEE